MDYSTHAGASALADSIRNYWLRLGYLGVKTEVVDCEANSNQQSGGTSKIFGVRSNIGPRGFPPREVAA